MGFRHSEVLVSASGAVMVDGRGFPAEVGNGTVFGGFPRADLETGVETAGDEGRMGVRVEMVGTQFGVQGVPMPGNLSLVNEGWTCTRPSLLGKEEFQLQENLVFA